MAHECGCHSGGATRSATPAMITSEQTVGDVAHHYPGTLEVMKEMCINHCCGAQLTLAGAAASAGVPLDALLKALNETRNAPA
jgi:regulator of cell morphogenesis and NO signaling